MGKLSKEQEQLIKEWLADGDTLSEVQRKLKEECGLTLTYMDVRLLALELNANVQDPVPPPSPKTPAAMDEADDEFLASDFDDGTDGLSGVVVTLDRVMRPGAVISGSVTFSDGEPANWVLDQMGQLGLESTTPGYQPTAADVQSFQQQLRVELQRHGYG